MDWSNEPFVRLYTRDTDDWLIMPWQSRALLPLLMRKCDPAGVVETKRGAKGIAALVSLPIEVVEVGIAGLLEDGCVVDHDRGYLIRNFLDAQWAQRSDKLRQQQSRARRRAGVEIPDHEGAGHTASRASHGVTDGHAESQPVTIRDETVTPRDQTSQLVTRGHEWSQPVTLPPTLPPSHPSTEEPDERDRARTRDPSVPEPATRVAAPAPSLPLDPHARRRGEILRSIAPLHAEVYNRVRIEIGSDADPLQPVGDEQERALRDLLLPMASYDGVEQACRHVLAVREAEALHGRTVQYLGAGIWKPHNYAKARALTVADVTGGSRERAPAQPRGVGRAQPMPASAYGVGDDKDF